MLTLLACVSTEQGVGGKFRAVKDAAEGAVDKTRRKLGRSGKDKTCRVHIKARAGP
jgi:hypothetical protein